MKDVGDAETSARGPVTLCRTPGGAFQFVEHDRDYRTGSIGDVW